MRLPLNLPMNLITGYKTYILGIGLLGLGVYQLSVSDYPNAFQSFLSGLAALGIKTVLDGTETKVANLTAMSNHHAEKAMK